MTKTEVLPMLSQKCDISKSISFAGVYVRDAGSELQADSTKVHDALQGCLFVDSGASVTLSNCDVWGCAVLCGMRNLAA